jgi:hypothetical protein
LSMKRSSPLTSHLRTTSRTSCTTYRMSSSAALSSRRLLSV